MFLKTRSITSKLGVFHPFQSCVVADSGFTMTHFNFQVNKTKITIDGKAPGYITGRGCQIRNFLPGADCLHSLLIIHL